MKVFKTEFDLEKISNEHCYTGRYSMLIKKEFIEEVVPGLTDYYRYPDVTIKIFGPGEIEDYVWGKEKDKADSSIGLIEATIIQNIFHRHGLSPRVYDLVYLQTPSGRYVCQVTEEEIGYRVTDRNFAIWTLRTFRHLIKQYHIENIFPDTNPGNIVNGKLVDLQGFKFTDRALFLEELAEKVDAVAGWGPMDDAYQSIDDMGHKGRRETNSRIKIFNFAEDEFKDKTVLDIGCSAGVFGNYAASHDARVVYGVDMRAIASVAQEVADALGIVNTNYLGYDLKSPALAKYLAEKSGFDKFDTVFYLAVQKHIGYPKYINELVGHTLYFEGHGETPESAKRLVDHFEQYYDKVETLGYSEDFNTRLILKCTR